MITKLFSLFRYINRIPLVARAHDFLHNLPRAVRAWVLMIAIALVCMLAMGGYATYLFLLYANEQPADTPVPSTVVSVQDVRELVEHIKARKASFVVPQVVDPAR